MLTSTLGSEQLAAEGAAQGLEDRTAMATVNTASITTAITINGHVARASAFATEHLGRNDNEDEKASRHLQALGRIHDGDEARRAVEIAQENFDNFNLDFMLNALRLTEGFEVNQFMERTGLPLNAIEKQLAEAEGKGLLYRDYKIIKPTELGRRFLNDLQQIFLDE